MGKIWTKEEMKEAIINFYRMHGKPPRHTDFRNKYGMPSYKPICREFGLTAISDILTECGIIWEKQPPPPNKIEEQLLKDEMIILFEKCDGVPLRSVMRTDAKFRDSVYADRYGSVRKACEHYGLIYKKLTKEEKDVVSISELNDMSKNLGRAPTAIEYDDLIKLGWCRKVLERHLKLTWNDIIMKYCIYDPNASTVGIQGFDKRGNLCRSIPELEITNFLIENNITYDKETSYGELISGDLRRFDWKIYINNNIYYVEYFGLYTSKPTNKLTKSYFKKTNEKIKDMIQIGKCDYCLFIFPEQYISGEYREMILDLKGEIYENKIT